MQKHNVKAQYSATYCIGCSHYLFGALNIQSFCASCEASLQYTAGPPDPSDPSDVHIGTQFGGKELA